MSKILHKTDKVVNGILQAVVVVMLAVMSCVVFMQIVFRMIHLSIPWSQELAQYLLVWCTFLGSALCIRRGSLVGLEIIFNVLPEKGSKVFRMIVTVCICVLLLLLIFVGFWAAGRVWYEKTAVLKLPMGLMYASIPVGSVFMFFNTLLKAYYSWKGEK